MALASLTFTRAVILRMRDADLDLDGVGEWLISLLYGMACFLGALAFVTCCRLGGVAGGCNFDIAVSKSICDRTSSENIGLRDDSSP